MIREIPANSGKVGGDVDPEHMKILGLTDARAEQNCRTAERSSCDRHFICTDLAFLPIGNYSHSDYS
ncbi:hypothetical protein [Nonomuraea sp. B19D2]|uniref:hypothetical protein n=1 Tax=Nonomuraea sp. B19D2 TaxID=3159561 RepID=UPI0032DACFF4